jgi:hypothetical protein
MARRLLGYVTAFFTRLVPAILTALGVVIVTAGLLSYADPATAGVLPTPSSTADLGPLPSISFEVPTADPSAGPGASAGASAGPSPSGGPAVATRIVIPALRIDLPIVAGPSGYPYCNVAMYQTAAPFVQPGQGGPVYIFAHARDGMFGPIYNLVMVRGTPNKMVSDLVEVYTSDNKLYQYEITNVYPHQLNMDRPAAASSEQLWLQTSEGYHIAPKTQVLAKPLSVGNADPKDAHPTPHPVVCG